MRKTTLWIATAIGLALASPASAQSGCPPIATGAVLTAAQWNACFTSKQNLIGYIPVNKAGDTMLGRLTTIASSTTASGFNLPPGAAPTSPNNGDLWSTSAGLYVQINGVTVGPLVSATSGTTIAIGTTPITGGTSGRILYNNAAVVGELATTGSGSVVRAASAVTTINGTACTLGTSCTAVAAAGTLTGATLASNVLTSSITTVGSSLIIPSNAGATASPLTLTMGSTYFSSATATTNAGVKFRLYDDGASNAHGFTPTTTGIQFYAGTSADFFWTTNNNGTERMRLTSAGAFSLNSLASTAQTNVLCYNTGTGNITYQTWATGCASSSERFKEGIEAITPSRALDVVRALRGVSYTYRPEVGLGLERHIGFTAEQVAAIEPSLAAYDADGRPYAVKYQEIGPYIIGAIQEQQRQIDELRRTPR